MAIFPENEQFVKIQIQNNLHFVGSDVKKTTNRTNFTIFFAI